MVWSYLNLDFFIWKFWSWYKCMKIGRWNASLIFTIGIYKFRCRTLWICRLHQRVRFHSSCVYWVIEHFGVTQGPPFQTLLVIENLCCDMTRMDLRPTTKTNHVSEHKSLLKLPKEVSPQHHLPLQVHELLQESVSFGIHQSKHFLQCQVRTSVPPLNMRRLPCKDDEEEHSPQRTTTQRTNWNMILTKLDSKGVNKAWQHMKILY